MAGKPGGYLPSANRYAIFLIGVLMDEDLLKAVAGATIIRVLSSGGSPSEVEREIRTYFPETQDVIVAGGLLRTVNSFAIARSTNGNMRVFMGGIDPAAGSLGAPNAGVLNVIRGYAYMPASDLPIPCNKFAGYDAKDVIAAIGAFPNLGRPYVELYGHSAGGLVAECILSLSRQGGVDWYAWFICTYGGPKPGWAESITTDQVRRYRYMTLGDITPDIPFSSPSGSAAIDAVTGYFKREIDRCVQPPGGILLQSASRQPASGTLLFRPREVVFQEWIRNAGEAAYVHRISTYEFYLRGNIRVEQNPPADREMLFPVAPDEAIGRDRAPFVIRPIVDSTTTSPPPAITIRRPGSPAVRRSGPTGLTTGVSPMMSRLRGKLRMTVEHPTGSPTWLVRWDNVYIANFSRPSQARTYAKRGNAWLRSMGNFSRISGSGIVDALTRFLADAATGDGGNYAPPLNVF